MKAGNFSLIATRSAMTEYAIVLTMATIIGFITYHLLGT
jgi:hypothetical protein